MKLQRVHAALTGGASDHFFSGINEDTNPRDEGRQFPDDCGRRFHPGIRSEEHTSELQSQSNLVCRLLLEKKKKLTHIVLVYRCTKCIRNLSLQYARLHQH